MQSFDWLPWERHTNFTFYISDVKYVSDVIEAIGDEGYGEVAVQIRGDLEGNVVYAVTGYAEDTAMIRRVHERLVQNEVEVEATY